MSEALQESGAAAEEAGAEAVVESTEEQAPELGDAGKKAIQAERDARKAADKRADELAAELKSIRDAQLSVEDRAKQEAAATAAELAALRLESNRKTVALDKGVPVDLLEFLTAETKEAMEAQADTLLARINAPKTPKPDTSQGASGTTSNLSTAQQFAQWTEANSTSL